MAINRQPASVELSGQQRAAVEEFTRCVQAANALGVRVVIAKALTLHENGGPSCERPLLLLLLDAVFGGEDA